MTVPELRTDLGADHAVARVTELLHVGVLDRLGEARPATARIELIGGCEERLAGHDIHIDPGLFVVEKSAGSGAFGSAFLRDAVLLRGQGGDGFGRFPVLRHALLQARSGALDMARALRRCKRTSGPLTQM